MEKCLSETLKFITQLLSHSSWPLATLIIFFSLISPIRNILKALANLINKVEKFGFKDLSVTLSNPNVPQESKIMLTELFINRQNDLKGVLDRLSNINKFLKKMTILVKNPNHASLQGLAREDLIKGLFDDLEKLLNILLLYRNMFDFEEEISLIEDVKNLLCKKPDSNSTINWPLLEALQRLDQNWKDRDRDANDFQFSKKLKEKVINLLNN